jgi:acyl-CoA thioesterase-2
VKLGEDPGLHACGLAYVSDVNPMGAVTASHPHYASFGEADFEGTFMGASLDHAIWFHRPVRADDWMMLDLTGHGMIESRGLATGPVFDAQGGHVATIAQEGLLRVRRKQG